MRVFTILLILPLYSFANGFSGGSQIWHTQDTVEQTPSENINYDKSANAYIVNQRNDDSYSVSNAQSSINDVDNVNKNSSVSITNNQTGNTTTYNVSSQQISNVKTVAPTTTAPASTDYYYAPYYYPYYNSAAVPVAVVTPQSTPNANLNNAESQSITPESHVIFSQ